jgi:aspartate aminotransferase-like enzyme
MMMMMSSFQDPPFLMIPGPTPLPEAVRQAMGTPAVGHRSPEFKAVLERVFPRLQQVFGTQHPVLLYTASATGAMEGALQNVLNGGDKVLVLVCGVFSARWATMAESLGAEVTTVEAPVGQANTVASLQAALATADPAAPYKLVVWVHSETSTGVLNPVQELAACVRQYGALSLVDTVTGLLASPFAMDDWGIDMAVSGSQKAFMVPPGLSFLAVNDRALAAHKAVKHPGFYFNFTKNMKAQAQYTTAYTPATHLILALDVALDMMLAEGVSAINARHEALTQQVRQGLKALGLPLLVAADEQASRAVTAVRCHEGFDVGAFRSALKKRFNITVADGQAELKGKIFRVGHLGFVHERDVTMGLACIARTLGKA